jgi:nitrogen regulatory protein PII
MKKIEVVLRCDRLPATREALAALGIDMNQLTVTRIECVERPSADSTLTDGSSNTGRPKSKKRGSDHPERVKLEVTVGDPQVTRIIDAILVHGRAASASLSGSAADDRVTVLPIEASLAILPLGEIY